MAYLGNRPAESYASFERQVFTIVNSQTAYTLSHSVTNENDIRLVVNNVVQEPGSGKAYTASGTTLTLSAALTNGTDEMYCVFLGRALQTVNPPNASVGSAQVADSLISGKTALGATPADTDELLISDAGTLKRVDYSYLKSANTPAFFANASTNQDISSATATKVTLGNEAYDTDSAFADSKFTVPSGEAGKYFFNFAIDCHALSVDNLEIGQAMIYKNGSLVSEHILDFRDHPIRRASVASTLVLDLSVSDYIELYTNIRDASGSPRITGDSGISTYLGGFKIIGA